MDGCLEKENKVVGVWKEINSFLGVNYDKCRHVFRDGICHVMPHNVINLKPNTLRYISLSVLGHSIGKGTIFLCHQLIY